MGLFLWLVVLGFQGVDFRFCQIHWAGVKRRRVKSDACAGARVGTLRSKPTPHARTRVLRQSKNKMYQLPYVTTKNNNASFNP